MKCYLQLCSAAVFDSFLCVLRVRMSDVSDDEPFEDSGSEYLPSGPDTDSESDDSLSSISEDEDHIATIMGNFTVVADPFSVC